MFKKTDRKEARERHHLRVRERAFGTSGRPRLSIYRSGKNIYAQIINDADAVTLTAASSLDKAIKVKENGKEAARLVGELVAKRAIEKGVNDAVFNRGGYICHGRVEALASGTRETGSKF